MNLFNRYLLAKPTIRMMVEWPIIIVIGIIGTICSSPRIPFYPISNIIGVFILITGLVFHAQCHKVHQQAHQQSNKIDRLLTTGIYIHIRHPMYTSLILIYIGVTVAWGIIWILVPVFVFSVLTILTALQEEKFLIRKLENQYKDYIKKVPYRFIPKII